LPESLLGLETRAKTYKARVETLGSELEKVRKRDIDSIKSFRADATEVGSNRERRSVLRFRSFTLKLNETGSKLGIRRTLTLRELPAAA
jgi:hypothetical protein